MLATQPKQIMDGVVLLREYVSLPIQRQILTILSQVSPPAYTPTTKFGGQMKLKMNCLGNHWNPKTYRYEPTRSDYDGAAVAEIPESLNGFAQRAVLDSGMLPEEAIWPFDVCIANEYQEITGKLGFHRDNSESEAAIKSGYPIVSISIGAAANFYIGPDKTAKFMTKVYLESGDVLLFGGPARLHYHGVTSIATGTCPSELNMGGGRVNLTFRIL